MNHHPRAGADRDAAADHLAGAVLADEPSVVIAQGALALGLRHARRIDRAQTVGWAVEST